MKRVALLFVIVIALLITIACGGSTPAATQIPAQPAATQAPAQPAATETPASSEGATTVTITLSDNKIESSLTAFQVGVPYTFVITNTGRRAHNFNIAPPVSVKGSLDAALSSALLAVNRDQLQSGESVTAEFTFPDSAVDQNLEFSCLIPKHYEDDMLLAITVTK